MPDDVTPLNGAPGAPPASPAPPAPPVSPAPATGNGSVKARVRQVRDSCLNAHFAVDYYKRVNEGIGRYARHMDFCIGLGTVATGGSGLGILGDPRLAWLCGLLTTGSLVLTIAKTAYNWPRKSEYAVEAVEKYGALAQKLQFLIDDMNVAQHWTEDFETRYRALREEMATLSARADPFDELKTEEQRVIQQGIKNRIRYDEWWSP